MRKPLLVLMVKEPRLGLVKTRLGADIGRVPATWWFRHQTRRLIRELGDDPRWDCVLSVSPDICGLTSRFWPAHLERWPQGRGDLGARMLRALGRAGPHPVLLIGGDIPHITPHIINGMFAKLRSASSMLAPAEDGGFWAIGVKRGNICSDLTRLSGVSWSTDAAFGQARTRLAPLGPVAIGPMLRDVDTAADLAAVANLQPPKVD